MSLTYRVPFGGTDSSRRLSCDTLILVLGAILIASGSARQVQASCGDWLAHSLPAGPFPAGARGDLSFDVTRQAASKDQEVPFRCRGPFCGQARRVPLPTAPLRIPVKLKDYGCLAAFELNWMSGVAKAELDQSNLDLPQGHPQRIERPPR